MKPAFNYLALILALGGLVIGLGIGLSVARLHPMNTPTVTDQTMNGSKSPMHDDIFTTQNATINGKVTAVDDTSITISSPKGSATFKLNQQVYVLDTSPNSKPSTDVKTIPLNQEVVLNLQKTDGEFKVMSITAIRPGSPAPIPSNFPISSPPAQK